MKLFKLDFQSEPRAWCVAVIANDEEHAREMMMIQLYHPEDVKNASCEEVSMEQAGIVIIDYRWE